MTFVIFSMSLEPDINLLPKDLIDKKRALDRGSSSREEQIYTTPPHSTKAVAKEFPSFHKNIDQSELAHKSIVAKPVYRDKSKEAQKEAAQSKNAFARRGIFARIKKISFKDMLNIQKFKNLFHSNREQQTVAASERNALEVELLPEEYVSLRSAMPEAIRIALIVLGFVVFYGCLGLYYRARLKKIQTAGVELQKEVQLLDAEITVARAKEKVTKDSIKVITTVNTLLVSRSDWARFFNRLEELTLKRVYYTTLKTETGGSIKLGGRAPTLSDAILQIETFKHARDFIKKVAIEDFKVQEEQITVAADQGAAGVKLANPPATYSSSFIEFPITLTLEPEWFIQEAIAQ